MIFHPEEYQKAQEYWKNRSFAHITDEQRSRINDKGKELVKFHLAHPGLHHLISLSVFILIFALGRLTWLTERVTLG